MNFLQLCQRVAREVGVPGTGPASVSSQTGELARIVNWVRTAWEDVQTDRPDWLWMRDSFSFVTTLSDRQYSPADCGIATRFSSWDSESLRIYRQSQNDEMALYWMPYAEFRATYIVGPQTTNQPLHATLATNRDLLLGPTPDDAYTINGEYRKSPQELAADADEPEIPSEYHMMIVYRAMMMYARYNSAPEIYEDAAANYKRIKSRLEWNQLPDVDTAGTLA